MLIVAGVAGRLEEEGAMVDRQYDIDDFIASAVHACAVETRYWHTQRFGFDDADFYALVTYGPEFGFRVNVRQAELT